MDDGERERVFKPSMTIHWVMFLSSALFSGAAISAELMSPRGWPVAVVFGALATIGPFANWGLARSAVTVTGSHVTYRTPFSSSQAELSRIQRVWFVSRYLVVDEGKIPRMVIPIYMAGISRLYALLATRAANNQTRGLRV
jgi:hypothetical protein